MEYKLNTLKELMYKYKSAVIAFSGGVDSTFLAKRNGMLLRNYDNERSDPYLEMLNYILP